MAKAIPQGPNGHPLTTDNLLIPLGCYDGVTSVNKFGTNESVGTTAEYVWEHGNGWTRLPAATTLEVASAHADDTLLGDGARTITIEGLDTNRNALSETVELAGLTPVLTTGEFLFVNRAYIATAGVNEINTGDVHVADDSTAWTDGVPDTDAAVQAGIHALHGQTQQAIYTMPTGKSAYLTTGYIAADGTKIVTYRFFAVSNGVKRIAFEGTVSGGSFQKTFKPYVLLPPDSTLYVDAKVDVGTASVSAGFDLILIDDNKLTQGWT